MWTFPVHILAVRGQICYVLAGGNDPSITTATGWKPGTPIHKWSTSRLLGRSSSQGYDLAAGPSIKGPRARKDRSHSRVCYAFRSTTDAPTFSPLTAMDWRAIDSIACTLVFLVYNVIKDKCHMFSNARRDLRIALYVVCYIHMR